MLRDVPFSGRVHGGVLLVALLCLFPLLHGQETPVAASGASAVVPVGVLDFQDESGTAIPDLGEKITLRLRQRLLVNCPDLLPKHLGQDSGASSRPGMTVDELIALGKQFGVKFIVRGGVLPVSLEPGETESNARVWLYADVVSIETGRIESVRVEGQGRQDGAASMDAASLQALDFNGADFVKTALGQAVASAVDALAEAIHSQVLALGQTPVAEAQPVATEAETSQPTSEEAVGETTEPAGEAAVDPAAQAAQSDEDLQQLIADAQAILGAGGDPDKLNQVAQSLESLNAALATQADLLQRGESTEQAEADVTQRKEELRSAIAAASQSDALGQSSDYASTDQAGQSLLAQADTTAGETISLIQKIKDLKAMLWGSNTETQAMATTEEQVPATYEEPLGEASGVVVDEQGQPVEGAEVTETESGATTTTQADGSYLIQRLPTGSLANIQVKAGGKTLTGGKIQILPGRTNLADFRVSKVATMSGSGVLSSTANGKAGKGAGGILKGKAIDAKGAPLARALVEIKGAGVVRTNSAGEFMFVNAPAGAHPAVLCPAGLPPQSMQVRVMAGKTSMTTLKLSGSLPVKAVKPIAPSLVVAGTGSLLQGQARDSKKKPLPGTKISVIGQSTAVSALSGSDGRYELRDLAPGAYRILASKPGYQSVSQDVTLRADKKEKRDFEMRQTSALVDSVRAVERAKLGGCRGRIRGQDSRAVAGALVEAQAIGAAVPAIKAQSNSDGQFSLSLREGGYDLRISKAAFRTSVRRIQVKAGETGKQDFVLQAVLAVAPKITAPARVAGQPVKTSGANASSSLSVAGKSSLAPGGNLEGVVRNSSNGKAVGGAYVLLDGKSATQTDGNGAYTLRNLAAGEHRVAAQHTGFAASEKRVTVKAGSSARVDFSLSPTLQPSVVQMGRAKTVAPAANGQLAGRVLDGKTGRAIAGATVSLSGVGNAVTDANGSYFFAQAATGSHQVSVARSGYQSQKTTIRIDSGRRATLDFQLTPALVVAPRVLVPKR
jgi:hypothetical protein